MSEYQIIDWDHIEKEVLEMQEILKKNGNPDPVSFRSPRYDELRDDILTVLCPFSGQEDSYYNYIENKRETGFVTTNNGMPFANILIKRVLKEDNFTEGMLDQIDELLLEAYSVIIAKIPAYNPDYNPGEENGFKKYIKAMCYYAMLDKYKRENTTEMSVRTTKNEGETADKETSSKRIKMYTPNDSFDRELTEDGLTYKELYASPNQADIVGEPYDEDVPSPFTDAEFDSVFPADYFMPEERCLLKDLTQKSNSKFCDFLNSLDSWKKTRRKKNINPENECAHFYDSVINYICDKENSVYLEKFLADRQSFSVELKRLGLESPEHQLYTADYIYSTCRRIKRRRNKLKKLRP